MFVAAFLIWMSSTNSPKIAEKTIYTKAVAIVFQGMWAKKLYFIVILGYSTPLISLRWNRLNNLPFFPMTFVNKCLYHVGQPVNISRPFVTEQWHWKIHKDTEIKRILWWSRGGHWCFLLSPCPPPLPEEKSTVLWTGLRGKISDLIPPVISLSLLSCASARTWVTPRGVEKTNALLNPFPRSCVSLALRSVTCFRLILHSMLFLQHWPVKLSLPTVCLYEQADVLFESGNQTFQTTCTVKSNEFVMSFFGVLVEETAKVKCFLCLDKN